MTLFTSKSIILPREIRERRKIDFSSGKIVESEWLLESFGKISVNVNRSKIEDWIFGAPKLDAVYLKALEGLRLTLYRDNTYYDEAINPDLEVEWINEYGELNNFHSTNFGKVKSIDSLIFIASDDSSKKLGYVRYSDGDTTVVDSLRFVDDKLIRSVSVVTDEVRFERYFFIYQKSK